MQAAEGEWLLLSNDDVIKGGAETENCNQLLLDVRFEPDAGKYTLLRIRLSLYLQCIIPCDIIKSVADMKTNRKNKEKTLKIVELKNSD